MESDDSGEVTKALGGLREQIDGIDRKIVALLKERQGAVEKVVSLKKKHNLPIYHPAREENLISEKRKLGMEVGLDPDYLENMFRTIIRRSRVEQAATLAGKAVRPNARILVVGGGGAMGAYFVRWFSEAGYTVRILEKDDWDRVAELCDGVDLAILSVPIDRTEAAATKLAPHLPADCVLTDVTSVKEVPVTAMLDAFEGPVLGLHPLFGPTTSTLDKQIVVATAGRNTSACRWVLDQFTTWGAVVVEASPKEHDEIMDIVQALRHFATFVFGRFLYKRRITLERTLEFSSPIYRLELGMVGRLFAQDPDLYSEIIFASPERRAILKEYVETVSDNLEMLEKGDKETFKNKFNRIAEWFDPFSQQAMRESTYLIDKLIERF